MIKRKNNIIALGLSLLLAAVPAAAFAEDKGDLNITGAEADTVVKTEDNSKNADIKNDNSSDDKDDSKNSKTAEQNDKGEAATVLNEDDNLEQYNVGWVKNSNGTYSLYDGLGSMVKSSWCKVGGKWYYLKDDGTMATGWVKNEGCYYYVGQWGNMHTGWIKDGGLWYYLDESGVMQKGWIYSNNAWYYLNSYGAMVTNDVIDGYILGSDGRCQ
ncbi:hypothetical protein [uncultured Clostridium sp.]|uniref:hypothetical protein n=1 Tax=uncultured Clostridium sp. TaxID=59620 RepID=UPI0025E9919F|nr:hypothetical protein [uncultured Clostridium sp.]